MLLSMPVMLMALSVHESAHGYAAYKLGDPTARNLGRITLNPVKHFDLFGFLSMLVFHIGWAKPVPINARYFKKPRRDMAITGAAGPLSNVCLALIHLAILRIVMIFITNAVLGGRITSELWMIVLSLIVYLLYMGVIMNIVLAIFNLIPIPPFDGSRIFYAFLPPKWYFGVMKYEQYIMIGCIIFLFLLSRLGINPLASLESWMINGLFTVTGMGRGTAELGVFNALISYLSNLMYA
ncbi:MAG: site-2 protease family protein [Ruminococcaceae bacterium]|nr:site-2 protease family protein [Oscillospiraceae bacterium]